MKSKRFAMHVSVLAALAWTSAAPHNGVAADRAQTHLYLVGVGPGDPDMATLRAINVMKKADLVFCSNGIKGKSAEHLQGKDVVDGCWRLFPYYGRDPSNLPVKQRREAEQLADEKLSSHRSSMVLFTMRAEFPEFIKKLSINDPPETPVAIVKNAGSASQEEVIRGTPGTIMKQVEQDRLPFEYLICVGDFLNYRYKKDHKTQSIDESKDRRDETK
jgi:precorrin-4 methylase